MENRQIILTMKQKKVNIISNELIPAVFALQCEEKEVEQHIFFTKPTKKRHTHPSEVEMPLGQALRASVTYKKVASSSGRSMEQIVRLYRKNTRKSSETILHTRYSRVSVSKTRVTFTMSFPLCEDPVRLQARLQNFANIIVDESDEVAAMLNQEGMEKVHEAWGSINQYNEQLLPEK